MSLVTSAIAFTLAGTPPPAVQIAPNVSMPALSLGHPDDGSQVKEGVIMWVNNGGRGLDTAYSYHNQAEVAAGVRAVMAKGVVREDLFITTKISPHQCTRAAALAAVESDIKELDGLIPDLVLHHHPCSGHHSSGTNAQVWLGLQDALKQRLTRAIGVSNYNSSQLEELLAMAGVPPALNQCQMSIGSHDDATINFCRKHGITYEAFSALRHIDLSDPSLTQVASAHQVSTAQVALRWVVQQGVPLATSPGGNPEYIAADLAIGDFTLADEEMALLSKL